jgi:hypothetical protein
MLAPYAPQDFPQLRQVVDPRLAGLPGQQLRSTIDSAFGDGMADSIDQDLEGIFDGFTRAMSQALPAITHIGGGVLQGAMAGSAAGLPGIIAGAAVGGTGAGLSRYGHGAARQVGNALSGVTQLAGQFTPMGQAGAALGSTVSGLGAMAGGGRRGQPGGGNALGQIAGLLSSPQVSGALGGLFGGTSPAGQLASAIQRPEVHQAIAALRLGDMGRQTLPVGPQQQPVPTAVFAQLLSHLAQQAHTMPVGQAAPHAPSFPGGPISEAESLEFMSDGEDGFIGDPSNAGDRAARLWDMLNESLAEQIVETLEGYGTGDYADNADGWGDYADDYAADAAWQDQLDLAEAEAIDFALTTEPRYGW